MADAPDAGQPAPSGKKGMIAFIAVGLFALASSITVGLVAFPNSGSHSEHAEESGEKKKILSSLPVPQILVNLRDSNGQRFLQSAVSLDLLSEKEDTVQTVFNESLARIQDRLIKILSSYSAAELDGGNRKDTVQSRVMKDLNENLFQDTGVEVAGVYFTEFVIQ